MKKLLVTCMVVLVAAFLASPVGAADFKMTWKGYMDVTAYSINANLQNTSATAALDSTNSYYMQELVISPIFHINDKVRIHNKVTIMERDWGGVQSGAAAYAAGTLDANSSEAAAAAATGGPLGGDQSAAHNFWWEQCYMSFPLKGGHLYVGRMSGGTWAYPFMDDEDNRDRIKYVRKFGHNVLIAVVEKLEETDGGNNGVNVYTNTDSDVDAYALGGVIPFSKDVIYKPLLYYVDYGSGAVTLGAPGVVSAFPQGAERTLFLNGFMFKRGPLKIDTEIIYITDSRESAPGTADVDGEQWLWWIDAAVSKGKAEVGLGYWSVTGEDNVTGTDNERNSIYGTGNLWEPLLLMHSNDIGYYNDSMGVANGTVGSSGFVGFYLRGAYKLSDAMKVSCIYGMLKADEMQPITGQNNGLAPDKELGSELDLSLDWHFMENISSTTTVAFFFTGDYYAQTDGDTTRDLTNDPYALMQKLTVEW